MQVEFAEIIADKPVQRFLLRFYLLDIPMQSLILVSPYVGTLEGTRVTLDAVCRKVEERGMLAYVITRSPEEQYHQKAVDTIMAYDPIELRYNESLHAKLYVCMYQDQSQSFALLGSANLTRHSIQNNIEIAMMIHRRGRGREIMGELSHWGL